jgi:hypothetical protein
LLRSLMTPHAFWGLDTANVSFNVGMLRISSCSPVRSVRRREGNFPPARALNRRR